MIYKDKVDKNYFLIKTIFAKISAIQNQTKEISNWQFVLAHQHQD